MNYNIATLFLALFLFCASETVWAQESMDEQKMGEEHSGRHHRGPPPEAYQACEGKEAGTTSSFVNHRGETVNGACQADENGKLALRPEHRPQ